MAARKVTDCLVGSYALLHEPQVLELRRTEAALRAYSINTLELAAENMGSTFTFLAHARRQGIAVTVQREQYNTEAASADGEF